METAAQRRSDRVSLTLLLEASGKDINGPGIRAARRTHADQSHRRGDPARPRPAPISKFIIQQASAQRIAPRRASVRVVGQFGRQKDGYLYGVEILDNPRMTCGRIEFPQIAESQEAVARMLLECSYCRAREVVVPERTGTARVSKPIAESRVTARRAACPASGRRRRTKTRRNSLHARRAAAAWRLAGGSIPPGGEQRERATDAPEDAA